MGDVPLLAVKETAFYSLRLRLLLALGTRVEERSRETEKRPLIGGIPS